MNLCKALRTRTTKTLVIKWEQVTSASAHLCPGPQRTFVRAHLCLYVRIPPGVIPPKVWSQTVSNSMMSPAELWLSVLLGHSGPRECVIQHLLPLVGQTLAHTSTQFTPGPTPLSAPRPKLPGSGHGLQSQNSGAPRAARLGPPSIVQIHSHYLGPPSERDKAFLAHILRSWF